MTGEDISSIMEALQPATFCCRGLGSAVSHGWVLHDNGQYGKRRGRTWTTVTSNITVSTGGGGGHAPPVRDRTVTTINGVVGNVPDSPFDVLLIGGSSGSTRP